MLRLLVLFAFLGLGFCADHATFKDCSRVNFCTNLRGRAPQDKYSVDANSSVIGDAVSLTLVANDDSADLTLTIFQLADNSYRIKLSEVDSNRYELKDVLDGEPTVISIVNVELSVDYLTIAGDNKVTVNFSPFNIEFYRGDDLEVVLDGSRLTFEQSLDQAYAFDVSFPQAVQLYGIHEHADSLALKTTGVNGSDPYRLRNLDVSGYELDSPMSLYGAIPVLYGHGPTSTTGIFLHNAAEQWVEVNNTEDNTQAYFMVESGVLDLFVFLGPTPAEAVRQYVQITGTAHLPQLWALGYHQCRWNYVSQEDVKDVVANFTTYDFPLDVIWLDIDYTDGKRYFTWDLNMFSDPVEMQQNISATHKRLVTIIDPHIKVEQGYSVYDGALANDLFVKRANGTNFEGDCWPGLSSYMDFLNPEARSYYGNYYSYENFPLTTPVLAGIWNDMNEPSVFDNSLEKTLPTDSVHVGGVIHRDIHNIYGLLHTMATHQGLMERDNGTKRPFVLTRSHFSGTQRYSAIWTGDNTADWGYLSVSYAECLDSNLLGIVFCGADVGGFDGNPDVELLQRWYQGGAWLPFYRAHANSGTERREPYLFDEDVQAVIRNAIQLRYKHLPTWYTLFYEHTRNKDPIIRPLFYQYPSDEDVYKISDQLLVGSDILVKVVAAPGVDSVQVYFPGGLDEYWFSITDSHTYTGTGWVDIPVDIQAIPVFYRRGSVIVRKDAVRLSSDEMADDGYSVHVNLDVDNKATGTVYIDDNTSFNYLNNKEFNYLRIDFEATDVLLITLSTIDEDANPEGFDFNMDDLIVSKMVIHPENGKPGRFESKRYTADASGRLLKDIKFKSGETMTIKLA